MLGLWFQQLSGICLQFVAIYIAVVKLLFLSLDFNIGLWYHYCGGIILLDAKRIATVRPLYSYLFGSCSHSLGDIIEFYAYIIATVYP